MHAQRIFTHESKRAKPIAATLAVAGAFLLLQGVAMAAGPATVDLGAAAPFAILSATGITHANNGLIEGDIGVSPGPGSSIQVSPAQMDGTIYATGAGGPAGTVVNPSLLSSAKSALTAAYNSAAGRTPVPTGAFLNPGDGNIGGMTLGPGLYKFTGAARVVGLDVTLTGGANDVWIFQIASNFYLGQGIYTIVTNGAQAKNVFWQVGDTALLDEFSWLSGTLMARQTIAMMTNVSVTGRTLSMNGSVAFGGSDITVTPDGSSIIPPSGLWSGATDLGGGWKHLSWFGSFIDTGTEWIWHAQHGWMYSSSTSTTSMWLWTFDLGWLWTSSTYYPYMYRYSSNHWLWYQRSSSTTRYFYNLNTTLWEKH